MLQHNLMFYFSYEAKPWNFQADVQVAPEDGGLVSTARLIHAWRNAHQVQLGFRTYGGAAGSIYRHVPNTHELFFKLEGIF